MYYWTARNNSSFLNGRRSAKTLRAAVIAARKYVCGELYGEGEITFFDANGNVVRRDEKSIFTGQKWQVRI